MSPATGPRPSKRPAAPSAGARGHLGEPGRILEAWRAASIARSVPAMREIYSDDANYDFPFTGAGFPSRLTGRAAILDFLASTWATGLVSYERYETIAAYR